MLDFGSGAARFMSDLQRGRLAQRTDQRSLAKLDLETVVPVRDRLREGGIGCGAHAHLVELLALQVAFRLAGPPRDRRHPAERDTCLLDGIAIEVERDRRGGQREFVRTAVANLQEQRTPGKWGGRYAERGDQFSWRQGG